MEQKNSFFSIYKKDIFKLFTTHFVMALFGLMIYLPWNQEKEYGKILAVVCSFIAILFYAYLVDLHIWDLGAKDYLNSSSRGTKINYWTGVLLGLVAAIPSFVLGLLLNFFVMFQTYEWAINACYLTELITKTWEAPFMGIQRILFPDFYWYYLITPFIPVLFSGLAYFLGAKNIIVIPRPKRSKE